MTINQIAVMTVNVVTGAPELDQGDTTQAQGCRKRTSDNRRPCHARGRSLCWAQIFRIEAGCAGDGCVRHVDGPLPLNATPERAK
jgi:hypothetical protein